MQPCWFAFQAFKPTDAPLPDPAYIYPPGVVPVSYCFGHPMSLDPKLLPVAPPLPPMPPPVDINEIPLPSPTPETYIDPETGEEVPIPELQPGFVPDWAEELAAATPSKKLARPDAAPHLQNISSEAPMTNGFGLTDPSSWLAKPTEAQPHYLTEHDSAPAAQLPGHDHVTSLPGLSSILQAVSSTTTTTTASSNGKKSETEKVEFLFRLPVNWKWAKDPESGRTYFYNRKTRQTSWEAPTCDEPVPDVNTEEVEMVSDLFILATVACLSSQGCSISID